MRMKKSVLEKLLGQKYIGDVKMNGKVIGQISASFNTAGVLSTAAGKVIQTGQSDLAQPTLTIKKFTITDTAPAAFHAAMVYTFYITYEGWTPIAIVGFHVDTPAGEHFVITSRIIDTSNNICKIGLVSPTTVPGGVGNIPVSVWILYMK